MHNQFNQSEWTLGFLKEYRRHPCLWQKSSPDYRNQMKRESAEMELSSLFGFKTTQELRRKIRSIQSSYNQAINKIRKRYKYTPKLSWFQFAHSFLAAETMQSVRVPVNTSSSKGKIKPVKKEIEYDLDDHNDDGDDDDDADDDANDNQNDDDEDNSNLQTSIEGHFIDPIQIINDEFDIYTKSWAQKYRKLNPLQQTYALKAIEEILGLGMLNQLDETTSIIKCNKQETAATTTTTDSDEFQPSSNYSFTLERSSSNQIFADPIQIHDNDNEQQIIPRKKQRLQQQKVQQQQQKQQPPQQLQIQQTDINQQIQQQNGQQLHPPPLDEDVNLAFGRYIGLQLKTMHEDMKRKFKLKCIELVYELSSTA